MNWFLLLLMLKLFTTNWSAPIDLVENREGLQQDLDKLINKSFSAADEANNLIKTSESLINSTVNDFNSSTVNESLNESLHKVEEDLHKFSSELQKELVKDSTQDAIEVSFEQKPIEEEVSAQVTEISSFDSVANKESIKNEDTLIHDQIPKEISSEYVGQILTNTESRSNILNSAETSAAAQDFSEVKVKSSENLSNQFQYSIDNQQQESSSTKEQSFQYPSSTNITDAQKASVSEELGEVTNTSTSHEHQNEQLLYSSTEDVAQKTTTEGTPNLERVENSNDASNLKQTVDNLAKDVFNIVSMVQTSTESSGVVDAHANFNIPETFTEEHSERTPSFRDAVDSFIEDIVEIGSKLGLATEQTSEPPSIINRNSKNLKEIQRNSANPSESSTEQHEQNTEYPSPNNKTDDFQQITAEMQPISNTIESSSVTPALKESNGEESSTETPALKETVDSFVNQVANISSSLGETVKEIIDDATTLKPKADNSNSVLSNETSTHMEQSETQNLKETHEKIPTLKEAVDAFVEDVVEIGSKLGFVPEQKPTEEVVPQIKEQENKTEESTASSDLNISYSNVEQSSINIAEAILSTNSSPENSNFGHSAETLIQSASEIGNSFSEAVSNLFSLSEAVTEIPNETSTKISTSEEQNKSNDLQTDSETSSTSSPIKTNIEISTTTENLFKTLNNKEETTHMHVPERESSSDQAVKEGTEEVKPKEEVKSVQFVEYIPVAVITIPEEELKSQRSAIAPQNETDQLQAGTKSTGEEHQVNNETKFAEDKVRTNAENKSAQKEVYETQSTPESQQPEDLTTAQSSPEKETSSSESSKSEEQTTSSPTAPESTTQAHNAVIEETTNAFNKFENTLKTLIEQEKLKQQEKHLGTLETNQQESTTLAPNSQTFTTVKKESNTLVPQDETTMLPKKFEEELQMAVKALEETTHHHFEEFQNNLKEAFKKFTVWGTEHERQAEATTNKHNIEATTQSSTKQPFTMKTEEDSASTTEKVVELSITKEEEEEPHRIGAINQNFVDRFSDSYQEKSEITATEEQTKEDESSLTSEPETTEITYTLTTTMSPVEDDEDGKGSQEEQLVGVTDSVDSTTVPNISEEKPTPTAENIVKDNVEEAAVTTESIPETTIMPLLARVPLHKDITSISLTTGEKFATESLAQDEAATQPLEAKETHTELTQSQTAQPTEREQETITLSSPESFPQEMVTFIEHHEDTTTVRQAEEEETTKEIEEKNTAKSQTQEPLTQAVFMEEQQQQIESTTEHEAQTQTAAASGQITATTANIEDDTMTTQQQQQEQLAEQQTTETEIYSTTVVEKEEEDETTVAAITSTTAATLAVEPEARSLSLPPPKLEYLQNEDGVEIFYGYSIVKHN